MSESETAEVSSVEKEKQEIPGKKRVRHRKKLLYERILKQMEFYFGDANLSKDRFLGQCVQEDPYVPIELFLKFNKIRAITQDTNDIAKAMKNSTLLELSEDRTKVKRKIPLSEYDADTRTVYVECLPPSTTRERIQQMFSDYGRVAYISLPKFRDSQRIKGYAFIEFEKPEEADNCISEFTKMGCKLPTSMPPEELSSIKTFNEEEPAVAPEVKDKKDDEEPPKKKSRKNKEKKAKLQLKLTESEGGEKRLEGGTEDEDAVATPTEESKSVSTPARAGGRKQRPTIPGALGGLQVLSKREWKQLRNRYLNLQRALRKTQLLSKPRSQQEPALPEETGSRDQRQTANTHVRFEDDE